MCNYIEKCGGFSKTDPSVLEDFANRCTYIYCIYKLRRLTYTGLEVSTVYFKYDKVNLYK